MRNSDDSRKAVGRQICIAVHDASSPVSVEAGGRGIFWRTAKIQRDSPIPIIFALFRVFNRRDNFYNRSKLAHRLLAKGDDEVTLTNRLEILIVDDEPKQRRGLASLVRSLRPAYNVQEAKNGREALELTQSRQPDIVFTDIQMPLVNGMEYLKLANEQVGKRIKVVFVSVFHEFGLAQQAIRLGAKDYLVKPVSADHLAPILEGLEQQIEAEMSEQSQARSLTHQLACTKPVYIEHLLYKWLTAELTPSEWSELSHHTAVAGKGTVIVMDAKPGSGRAKDREWASVQKRAITQSLSPSAETIAAVMEHEQDLMYIVVGWRDGASVEESLARLRQAIFQLKTVYGYAVRYGIGSETEQLERDIRACCDSAKAALEYMYYCPEDMSMSAAYLEQLLGQMPAAPVAIKDGTALEEAVTEGCAEQAIALMKDLQIRMAASYPPPFRLKCSVIQLLLACLKRVEHLMEDDALLALSDRIDREVLASDSLGETQAAAARLLTAMIEQLKKDKGARSEMIMQKCREYLEEHLHEDLGLEAVAQRFYYNASYFSLLFKNHFGMSFTDFLVKARMQKARGLLLSSDYKVAEIARQVGYKDMKYFSKVFKKMYLYPPEEFRRMFAS